MNRLLLPVFAGLAAGCSAPAKIETATGPWVEYPGGDGPGQGVRVVLVSGDEEYRSEEALPMLGKILSRHHGFDCRVVFAIDPESGEIDPDVRTNIPGLEALDDADVMVLFTRFRELPDEQMRHVVEFVESGKPVFGIRTATHAFAYGGESESPYRAWNWNEPETHGFGGLYLGETWVNHHGHHGVESTRGVVPDAVARHPVLRGVADVWGPTDVYGIRELPDDTVVLLEGSVRAGMEPASPAVEGKKNEPRMPITWIRTGDQRIACSTIGAASDLASEDLRRLFVNLVYWCAGLEERIPERGRADVVGTYEPTPFGFGGFVRGVRPGDHEL